VTESNDAIAAAQETGIGTFRTCVAGLSMSVAGGKAEVPELGHDFNGYLLAFYFRAQFCKIAV
jgi:hypothetical protein